jgi:uncharacterized protein YgfB (UPF0149 family)
MARSTYDEIRDVLAAARSISDAAEAHGTLAGALCAAPSYGLEVWFGVILPHGAAERPAFDALRGLYEETGDSLSGDDLAFQPLLPEDEQPIDRRAAALGSWCQGFLYGLGTSGIRDVRELPGEAGEIVRDLIEITQVGVNSSDGAETNEGAYAELVEFVRIGVQILYDDIASCRQAPPAATGDVLH